MYVHIVHFNSKNVKKPNIYCFNFLFEFLSFFSHAFQQWETKNLTALTPLIQTVQYLMKRDFIYNLFPHWTADTKTKLT